MTYVFDSYVYDVKATYIEGGKLRYKAEISLDGEQVVASYISKLGTDMERVKQVICLHEEGGIDMSCLSGFRSVCYIT